MIKSRKVGTRVSGLAVSVMFMVGAWSTGTAAQVSFKEDIFPILELRCLECHQPGGKGYEKSGLDFRTYEGLMKGTKYGPMVVPGRWIESNLLTVIDQRASPELWMPHQKKKLSTCERLMFRRWVMQGARNN